MTNRRLARPTATSIIAAVAVAVAAGAFGVITAGASSVPDLPQVGERALVASVLDPADKPAFLSGRATARIDLGLPSGISGGGGGDVLSMLTRDHSLRVWSSAEGLRIADLYPAGERLFVAGRSGLWGWDSETFSAIHAPVPGHSLGPGLNRHPGAHPGGPMGSLEPSGLAAWTLAAAARSTAVRVAQPQEVAGRDAYVLSLDPRTDDTLVGHVDIAIDAETRIPLRVEMFARGATAPAIATGFDSVSFEPIDSSVFEFDPPAGAKVEELAPGPRSIAEKTSYMIRSRLGERVRVFGRAWSTIVAVRVPDHVAGDTGGELGLSLERLLPLAAPLVSADLVSTGKGSWLVAGAVPREQIEAAAARLP